MAQDSPDCNHSTALPPSRIDLNTPVSMFAVRISFMHILIIILEPDHSEICNPEKQNRQPMRVRALQQGAHTFPAHHCGISGFLFHSLTCVSCDHQLLLWSALQGSICLGHPPCWPPPMPARHTLPGPYSQDSSPHPNRRNLQTISS